MKVLVTGAAGFVGKPLVAHLSAKGDEVIAAVRREGEAVPGASRTLVVPDIVGTEWADGLAGAEAVVHLAARVHVTKDRKSDALTQMLQVNRDATMVLARAAAAAGVKRFVFLSSVKAAVDYTSPEGVNEYVMPSPHSLYGVSKREAENELMRMAAETAMEIVILRPPLVYGPGVKANFATLVKAVRLRIPLPLASIDNRRSLLGLSNLIGAIDLSLTSPNAANSLFFLSDEEPVSTPDLILAIGAAMKRKPRMLPIPPRFLHELGELLGRRELVERLTDSLVVHSTSFREATGWQTQSMTAELERLVDPSP